MPLQQLLHGGTDPSYSSTEYFLTHYITEQQFIVQLIVSRAERMAAVTYHAANDPDAPQRVKPIKMFWSYNYASRHLTAALVVALMLCGFYVVMHDLRQVFDRFAEYREHRGDELKRAWSGEQESVLTGCTVELKSLCSSIPEFATREMRRPVSFTVYTYLVEFPSISLPLILEFARPHMLLPQWIFCCTCTEMILTLRLLHEGKVVPALSLVVRVIDESVPNLVALLVVLVPISVLTAIMHSQLFGIFDAGYADPWIALTRVVRMLTSPPPTTDTEGTEAEASPVGSELMYYWYVLGIPTREQSLHPANHEGSQRVAHSNFVLTGPLSS